MPVHREVVDGLLLDSIAYNFTPLSSVSMHSQVTELPLVVTSYFTYVWQSTQPLAALHRFASDCVPRLPSPGFRPARRVSAEKAWAMQRNGKKMKKHIRHNKRCVEEHFPEEDFSE
eukprot:COSAG02_NODE_24992_length_671_cov_1.370629_1_plen_115_part_10